MAACAVIAGADDFVAIAKLLEIIEVSGALVTIDAMGCQTAIAAKIINIPTRNSWAVRLGVVGGDRRSPGAAALLEKEQHR